VLAVHDAEIGLASAARGERWLAWDAFLLGVKRNALEPDELIVGARWRPIAGPQSFSKIGTRNAMVIAIASLCLVLDEEHRRAQVALGSVGPTIIRAGEAESFVAAAMTSAGAWDDRRVSLPPGVVAEFAERVAAAARPIDDVRGTAVYRRHGCRILARRSLSWALEDRRLAA